MFRPKREGGDMGEGYDITRRRVLGGAIAALAFRIDHAFAAPIKKKRKGPPAGKKRNLYLRKRKKRKFLQTKLDPGLYENPKSHVVHPVDAKKRIRVGAIKEARLKKLKELPKSDPSPGEVRKEKAPPHLNLAAASVFFEQQALANLKKKEKETEKASDLLLRAVRHDTAWKLKSRQAPNFRLWDLGVGVAHRFGHKKQFDAFIQAAQLVDAKHPRSKRLEAKKIDFKPRLKKWLDTKSRWAQLWGNKKTQIRWETGGKKGESQALVF